MKEPIWLQKNVVIAFHEMLLVEHGGLAGMREEGLLDSALGRPIHQYYYDSVSDIFDLASTYAMGIIQNHPFIDGNKRTGFVSMKTFLARNGLWLKLPKEDAIKTFISLADGKVSHSHLSEWIKRHL